MRNVGASALRNEFRNLSAALHSFEKTLQRVIVSNVANGSARRVRMRRRLSPKARAALVLQGRYMGFMRQLKPKQKAQVRKVREAKGVRAAIARARELGGV